MTALDTIKEITALCLLAAGVAAIVFIIRDIYVSNRDNIRPS